MQAGRGTQAQPHLVPRGEEGRGVQPGQDDHQAGQEDVLPLLPRDLQRGGGGCGSVQGHRQERVWGVPGHHQPHLRGERRRQAQDPRRRGAEVPLQADHPPGRRQPGDGVPAGGPPPARDHLVPGRQAGGGDHQDQARGQDPLQTQIPAHAHHHQPRHERRWPLQV